MRWYDIPMPPDLPSDGRADEPVVHHDDGNQPDAEDCDANDPRRQKDCFAPPAEPCECYCLHCQRTFMSDQILFQRIIGAKDGFEGKWLCPTHNCDGAGFT